MSLFRLTRCSGCSRCCRRAAAHIAGALLCPASCHVLNAARIFAIFDGVGDRPRCSWRCSCCWAARMTMQVRVTASTRDYWCSWPCTALLHLNKTSSAQLDPFPSPLSTPLPLSCRLLRRSVCRCRGNRLCGLGWHAVAHVCTVGTAPRILCRHLACDALSCILWIPACGVKMRGR